MPTKFPSKSTSGPPIPNCQKGKTKGDAKPIAQNKAHKKMNFSQPIISQHNYLFPQFQENKKRNQQCTSGIIHVDIISF